ncbi:MAG: glutaredoxin 3 [Alphaproteobacteria bacterium]|nr:glutaredoxin 3 [Alphaproteobacteria bacterium]
MKSITIYTTNHCPYCIKAKKLFDQKGVTYTEIDVSHDDEREKMIAKAHGKRTVPQIFIGDYHVGGCDDLYALDKQGKLDSLLM